MINIRVILSLSLLTFLVHAQSGESSPDVMTKTVPVYSEYRVPDSPENVRIKTTSTSATLWWDPPSSAGDILVRGYTISYGIETPSKKIVIEGVETNSFKIEGLKTNTTYVFAVTAYNEADGEDSEKILVTAKTAGAKKEESFRLPAPSDIAVTAVSSRDVDVAWKDTIPKTREENRPELGTKKRYYLIQ